MTRLVLQPTVHYLRPRIRIFSPPLSHKMSSKDSKVPNASGLTPEQSKALGTRQPREDEEAVISALKELYSCKPTTSSYRVYDHDAVFHDPIGIAKGVSSIQAQFNGLPKIFPRADIHKFNLLENPPTLPKSTMLIDQDVAYYRKPNGEPTKIVNSLLTIERTAAGAITKHTEEWNHQRETTSEDGFLGTLNEWRKTATAGLTSVFVGKTPPGEQ